MDCSVELGAQGIGSVPGAGPAIHAVAVGTEVLLGTVREYLLIRVLPIVATIMGATLTE
jgi:hypothetical protein